MFSTQPGQPALDSDPAIIFPDGLVGCPDWKRFVLLVDDEEELPVAILRSLDNPHVELLITDPALVDPTYASQIVKTVDTQDPVVYCTLTVGDDGWISANLMGPLVIDPLSRQGRQIVLADSGYSTRHPVAQAALAHEAA